MNSITNQNVLSHDELTYLKALYILNNKYNFKNRCFNKDGTISFKRHSLTQDENQFVFCKCCKLLKIRNYDQLKHLLHNNHTNITLIHININTLYSKFTNTEPKRIPKYKIRDFNKMLSNVYTTPIDRFKRLIPFIHKHGVKIRLINPRIMNVDKDFLSLKQLYSLFFKKSYEELVNQNVMRLPFNYNLYNLNTFQFIVPNLNLNLYYSMIRPYINYQFSSDSRGIALLKFTFNSSTNEYLYIANLMNISNCVYTLRHDPNYKNMALFYKDYKGNNSRIIIHNEISGVPQNEYIEAGY